MYHLPPHLKVLQAQLDIKIRQCSFCFIHHPAEHSWLFGSRANTFEQTKIQAMLGQLDCIALQPGLFLIHLFIHSCIYVTSQEASENFPNSQNIPPFNKITSPLKSCFIIYQCHHHQPHLHCYESQSEKGVLSLRFKIKVVPIQTYSPYRLVLQSNV